MRNGPTLLLVTALAIAICRGQCALPAWSSENQSAGVRRLVAALRQLVRRIAPDALETELWGSLSYHRPGVGGRVKGAVCQIVAKRGRVRLDFIHGIRLSDPAGLLEGDAISKRYVPIATPEDIRRPAIAALIREAAALDPAAWAEPDDLA
jgi:hypothetical protein